MPNFSFELLLQRQVYFIVAILYRVFINSMNIVQHILPLRASVHVFVITCKVERKVTLNYNTLFNLLIFCVCVLSKLINSSV